MSQFTLKSCETPHAITIDILDEQNIVQLNTLRNAVLNLTWIWDGDADKLEEKQKLLNEIQDDLAYVEAYLGWEVADTVVQLLYTKIDTVYS